MDYKAIKEILEKLLGNYYIPEKAKIYIKDYIMLIGRNIMEDKNEIRDLCAQVYSQHQQAFDAMYEYMAEIKNKDEFADNIYAYLKDMASTYKYELKSRAPTGSLFFTFNGLEDVIVVRVERYTSAWRIRVLIWGTNQDKREKIYKQLNDNQKKKLGNEFQLSSDVLVKSVEFSNENFDTFKDKFEKWYNGAWMATKEAIEKALKN